MTVPRKNNPGRVQWDLFFEGDAFYRRLLRDLSAAKQSIAIEMYIFDNGARAAEIWHALELKARRVRVRVLVDGIGSFNLSEEKIQRLTNAGIDIRVFRPLRLYTLFRSGQQRRNHRKLITIDRKVVYIGGMNVADVHSRRISGKRAWRDTMIRVTGGIGHEAEAAFEAVWRYARRKHFFLPRRQTLSRSGVHGGFRLVANTPMKQRRYASKALSTVLRAAEKTIWIEAAYFTPRRSIVRLLKKKAEGGIDVRILCPGLSDVPAVQWAGRSLYTALIRSGARIWEYQGRVLHTKAVVVDDKVSIIGSTNLDHRSFLLNLELDVIVERADVSEKLAEQFVRDLKNAREINAAEWSRRPFLDRVREGLFYWMRRYL